jgi:Flp pilus assembly protein TadB
VSRREQDPSDVYTITSATGSRSADMQQRAGRYLVSMLIRTLCVVLVIVVPGPLRWVFVVGAIVLPYVAVIAANNVGERRSRPLPPPAPGLGRSLPGPAPAATVQRPPAERRAS